MITLDHKGGQGGLEEAQIWSHDTWTAPKWPYYLSSVYPSFIQFADGLSLHLIYVSNVTLYIISMFAS